MRAAVARVEPAALVAAGCALLLVRPLYEPLPIATTYAAIGLMALRTPSWSTRDRHLNAGLALTLGLVAVSVAPAVAGPAPALRVAGAMAIALNVGTSVAEEAFFRKLTYGWLERWGAVVAIGVSALVFALIHVPTYGVEVLPVDLGAGLLFGWQRWATGSWAVPAATHAWANLVSVIA